MITRIIVGKFTLNLAIIFVKVRSRYCISLVSSRLFSFVFESLSLLHHASPRSFLFFFSTSLSTPTFIHRTHVKRRSSFACRCSFISLAPCRASCIKIDHCYRSREGRKGVVRQRFRGGNEVLRQRSSTRPQGSCALKAFEIIYLARIPQSASCTTEYSTRDLQPPVNVWLFRPENTRGSAYTSCTNFIPVVFETFNSVTEIIFAEESLKEQPSFLHTRHFIIFLIEYFRFSIEYSFFYFF